MFDSYDNNFDSSSNSETILSYSFLGQAKSVIVVSSSKRLGVEDIKTWYTTEEKVASFRKSINLFGSDEEEDVILELCIKEEQLTWHPLLIHQMSSCKYISQSFMI